MDGDLATLSAEVGTWLAGRGWRLATAESCTGGWIAEVVTATSGSSGWFDRGFVTYSNEAKTEMLGVRPATLTAYGAVSEETVREMAAGALGASRADVALAVSGIAGPTGGTAAKPVGMVCFAWAVHGEPPRSAVHHFTGDREAVRRQAVVLALRELVAGAKAPPPKTG